jgi:DNA-directed RNA polymerase specialized sigma24 family protein
MKINQKIAMLKEEIKEKEYELRTIKEKAVLFSAPKGYSKGTSYEIHDCIHGSKKSVDIYKLAEEIERLEVLIDIDKHILRELEKGKDIEKKVNEIENMEEKLVYLRKLGLTVEEASEVLYISTRQAYRYLRRVREREE